MGLKTEDSHHGRTRSGMGSHLVTAEAQSTSNEDVEDSEFADVMAMFAALQHRQQVGDYAGIARQRELIITRCLGLADRIARHYRGRGQDLEDLTQVARLGLVKAVNRFDPAKGSPFVAFAVPTMMGEVRRHFRDTGWSTHVPRQLKDRHATVTRATTELTQTLGCAPTAGQLATHLDLTRDEVIDSLLAREAYQTHSTDAPISGGGAVPRMVSDTIGALDVGFDRITDREAVRPLLAALPPRERTVLYLRFFESMSQSQIAEHIGVSQMHVSRILDTTLRALRDQL